MKGFHHFYLGIVIVLTAFFLIWSKTYIGFVVGIAVTGVWLMIDDFYQHLRQRYEPEYHSPAHRLYGMLYKISWIRKINIFVDKLFGRDKDG